MAPATSAVFESIESAHEYVGLLCEAVDDAEASICDDMKVGDMAGRPRRSDALRLVDYKLKTLRHHLVSSRLLLNDLRTLRRYLCEERATDRDFAGAGTGSL